MNKVLIALNLLVLSVVLVFATGGTTHSAAKTPKWQMKTVAFSELIPDMKALAEESDRKAFLDGLKKLDAQIEAGKKTSQAEQAVLLNQGYEPFAVVKTRNDSYSPYNIEDTTLYFKKLR